MHGMPGERRNGRPAVTDDDDTVPRVARGRTRLAGAAAMCRPHFALLVLVVGLLGRIQDSASIPAPASWMNLPSWMSLPPWMNLHVLFGALLWVCVVARFYRGMRQAPRMLPAEVRALSRQLSRLVYLFLYGLMFFGLIIGILRAGLYGAMVGGAENFQSYLVGGLAALVTIRALAALCHRFVVQGRPFVIQKGVSAPPFGSEKRAADVARAR
jgi:cytochrome b561